MANEYISSDELKAALGMDTADTTRDNLIEFARASASKLIERETGRRFYLDASATARTFEPPYNSETVTVDDIGSTTGLIIETGSFAGSTWDAVSSSDYETGPFNAITRGDPITGVTRPGGWGNSRSRIRVTALWGWPATPEEIEQACLIQAVRLFKRKDSSEGVVGSADFGFARVSRVDPDVKALIAHLILPGF